MPDDAPEIEDDPGEMVAWIASDAVEGNPQGANVEQFNAALNKRIDERARAILMELREPTVIVSSYEVLSI